MVRMNGKDIQIVRTGSNESGITPASSNNARIRCSGFMPIKDISCVDEKQHLWKGTRIREPGSPDSEMDIIYFSRNYLPEVNDFDKIFTEKHITDLSILGYEFYLIPKDKVVFFYDPPSLILKPSINLSKRNGPINL